MKNSQRQAIQLKYILLAVYKNLDTYFVHYYKEKKKKKSILGSRAWYHNLNGHNALHVAGTIHSNRNSDHCSAGKSAQNMM